MTTRTARSTAAALLLSALLLPAFRIAAADKGGLYGDEGKDAKSGDLNDQDYWWTKFDMMMLDLAIKQHQPEGRIGFDLVSTQKRLDELTKKYPNHEQLKEWKNKADSIQKKINPNASRSEYFKPGCPWEESNFAQLWVNYHWAKMEAAENKRDQAIGLLQNVLSNCQIMTRADRMKDYPEDLRKWVEDTCPQAEKMMEDLKAKNRR